MLALARPELRGRRTCDAAVDSFARALSTPLGERGESDSESFFRRGYVRENDVSERRMADRSGVDLILVAVRECRLGLDADHDLVEVKRVRIVARQIAVRDC